MSAIIEVDSEEQELENYLEAFNNEIEEDDDLVIEPPQKKSGVSNNSNVTNVEDGTYYVYENGTVHLQQTDDGKLKPKRNFDTPSTRGSTKATSKARKQTTRVSIDTDVDDYVVIANEAKSQTSGDDTYELFEDDVGIVKSEFEIYDIESVPDEEFNDVEKLDVQRVVKVKPKQTDGGVWHQCTHCAFKASKAYLLSRHMKIHASKGQFKCTVCDKEFKIMASLKSHLNVHLGRKPFPCSSCEMRFTTSGELTRHTRYKHTHEKPHKCTECDYSSVELSKLRRHIRAHTGERPYQCPHCTYASPDTFKLKRHLRTHTGDRPYECDICHARFTQSNSLKAHRMIHNVGDKPVFQCTLCPTTCGRRTDLRLHMQKLHHSDNPIPCKRCGRELPDRYNYKMHLKTHEGERCYRCDMCPYASMTQRNLIDHKRVHSNEKPYECTICNKSFRQKQLLTRHNNLYHTEGYQPPPSIEKTHKCPYCPRLFAHKGNMLRHMNFHDNKSTLKSKKNLKSTDNAVTIELEEFYGDGEADYSGEEQQDADFLEDIEGSLQEGETIGEYEILEIDGDFKQQITTSEAKTAKSTNNTTFHMEIIEDADIAPNVQLVKKEKGENVLSLEENVGEVQEYMIVKVLQSDNEDDGGEDATDMDNVEIIEIPSKTEKKARTNNRMGFVYKNEDSEEFI